MSGKVKENKERIMPQSNLKVDLIVKSHPKGHIFRWLTLRKHKRRLFNGVSLSEVLNVLSHRFTIKHWPSDTEIELENSRRIKFIHVNYSWMSRENIKTAQNLISQRQEN